MNSTEAREHSIVFATLLTLGGFVPGVVVAFMNPDMAPPRLFLTYWWLWVMQASWMGLILSLVRWRSRR